MPFRYNVARGDGRICCRSDNFNYLCGRCQETLRGDAQSVSAPPPLFPRRRTAAALSIATNAHGVPDPPPLFDRRRRP